MFCRFSGKNDRNRVKAQIAVFLLVIIVVTMIFIVITMNIGDVSKKRTMVSNAADSGAIKFASLMSSIGWAQWLAVLDNMHKLGEADEFQNGRKFEVCKFDPNILKSLILLVGAVILACVSLGGGTGFLHTAIMHVMTVIGAIGSSVNFVTTVLLSGPGAALLQNLPYEKQIMEEVLSYSLAQVVDDQKTVPDIHDINGNGDTKEEVSYFQQWYFERLRDKGKNNVAVELRDKIKQYHLSADHFRQYVGGTQEFPELLYMPDVENYLKSVGSIPASATDNCYYPEDGEMIRLMAEFAKKGIPRRGCNVQQPIRINNVNVRNITAPFNYTEELVYYFPFWEYPNTCTTDPANGTSLAYPNCARCATPPYSPCNGGANPDPIYEPTSCEIGGQGSQDRLLTRVDEVDYIVDELERFRYWAWGVADRTDYTAPITSNEESETGQVGVFNRGVGQFTDSEARTTVGSWAKDLIDLPDVAAPTGAEDPNNDTNLDNTKWCTHIYDWLRKIKGSGGNCGWWKEFYNVIAVKRFQNTAMSDFTYPGLGKLDINYSLPGVPCSGKRLELRQKMDTICNYIRNTLVPRFNTQRCAAINLQTCDGSWVVEAQASWLSLNTLTCGYATQPCSKVLMSTRIADIQKAIQTVTDKINLEVNPVITRLTNAVNACYPCCSGNWQTCKSTCPGFSFGPPEQCLACGGDEPACNSACWGCLAYSSVAPYDCITWGVDTVCHDTCCYNKEIACANCINDCLTQYNTCLNKCTAIQNALNCRRNTDLANLTRIYNYLQMLLTLANSTIQVENYILRLETALYEIDDFYTQSTVFFNFITDSSIMIRVLSLIDPNNADDKKITYKWTTTSANGDIDHTATVELEGDVKMPTIKGKRCYWIFGYGAYMVDHEGDVKVRVSRYDTKKDLLFRLFGFTFQTRRITAEASAHYSPRLRDIKFNSVK